MRKYLCELIKVNKLGEPMKGYEKPIKRELTREQIKGLPDNIKIIKKRLIK